MLVEIGCEAGNAGVGEAELLGLIAGGCAEARVFGAERLEGCGQRRDLVRRDPSIRLGEREEVGEFGDLLVETAKGVVLAARFLADEILREHEDREQEVKTRSRVDSTSTYPGQKVAVVTAAPG